MRKLGVKNMLKNMQLVELGCVFCTTLHTLQALWAPLFSRTLDYKTDVIKKHKIQCLARYIENIVLKLR